MKILNTWTSDEAKQNYFEVWEPLDTYWDYAVYKLWEKDYLYTYKNIAINELVVHNKQYFAVLSWKDWTYWSAKDWLFMLDRADKAIKKWLWII